jgi:hypothetical protein
MKYLLLSLLGVAVSGCATENIANYNAKPAESCSIAAKQLMQEGAMKGYSLGVQKAVYQYTYDDCVKSHAAYDIKEVKSIRVGTG